MQRGSPINHFPSKLHELLTEADEKGHSNVISWCPDGKSFRIHQPDAMLPIVSAYFRQTKYKSLLRQLQGYNFKRITRGEEKGNVSHPLFLRDNTSLCEQMKRKQNKKSLPEATLGPSNGMITGIATNETNTTVDSSRTQTNGTDLLELQSNVQRTKKNALRAPSHRQVTSVLSVPHVVGHDMACQNHRQQAASMEALRVEIGCTFSSSKNKNKIGHVVSHTSKRSVPQQPFLLPNIASSSEFGTGRHSKRRRSDEGAQGTRHSFHSKDLSSTYKNAYKNASFPTSLLMRCPQQTQDDAILKEENLLFQKSQQFDRLGPQRQGRQQFQHFHPSASALGTLDLAISLTTTTTTTHENGGDPEVSSSTVSNKFVFPAQFEPTPIRSPRKISTKIPSTSCRTSNGFTLNCDISFPSKAENKNNETIFEDSLSKSPSATIPEDDEPITECSSVSEVSDEIEEGLVDAFVDDRKKDEWPSLPFESNCEDDQEEEDLAEWTKGIIYGGKTDCVLGCRACCPGTHSTGYCKNDFSYNSNSIKTQQQRLQMHTPMAVLSREMSSFQRPFQQLQRRASF